MSDPTRATSLPSGIADELRKSTILLSGTAGTALLTLAYTIVAGRWLGPEEGADFYAALSIAFLITTAFLPLNHLVTRAVAAAAATGRHEQIGLIRRALARRVALGAVGALALGGLALPTLADLAQFRSPVPLALAGLGAAVTVYLSVLRGELRGAQRFGVQSASHLIESGTRLALIVALLALAPRAAGALAAYVAAAAVATLWVRRTLVPAPATGSTTTLAGGDFARLALPLFFLAACEAGFQNFDLLFVKHRFAAAAGGTYGAATMIARAVSVVTSPFAILLLPIVTQRHERREHTAGPVLRLLAYFLALAAGLLGAFWLWPTEIVTLLYGDAFREADVLLLPLSCGMVLGSVATLIGQACIARRAFRLLPLFGLGFALEVLLLAAFGSTVEAVVAVMLAVKLGTTGALAGAWWLSERGSATRATAATCAATRASP